MSSVLKGDDPLGRQEYNISSSQARRDATTIGGEAQVS